MKRILWENFAGVQIFHVLPLAFWLHFRFDFEINSYKNYEGMIAKAVTKQSVTNGDLEITNSSENADQYKEIIRIQDKKVNELSGENEVLRRQLNEKTMEVDALRQNVYELHQQNAELKFQVRKCIIEISKE